LPCHVDAPDAAAAAGKKRDLERVGDQDLLEGLRQSSEAHFRVLYDRYFRRIYSFVYARVRNHADAEEVVQETFTSVFTSLSQYRGQSTLLSWIYGIAKNTANSNVRRARVQEERMEGLRPDMWWPLKTNAASNPEEQLDMRRCADGLHDRLESVAPWQSEIFILRHVDNLSISEICDRTDRSSDAIRSSLYRVKNSLMEISNVSRISRL